MNVVSHLLLRNVGGARMVGFLVSNLAGLLIVISGLQIYSDVRPIWESRDSFLKKDYLVINKAVERVQRVGDEGTTFSEEEINDLEKQDWVRSVGRFRAADYRVSASVGAGGRGLSTYMFFESLPSEYVDVAKGSWYFREGMGEVPIIISKDYLALYNFGFASSAGMPQISEGMLGSVPLELVISDEGGLRRKEMRGRIVGFSNRLNTILVPEAFMEWASRDYGSGGEKGASRLIIDVSSPGDAAIGHYFKGKGYEIAGDKSSSQASYLVKVVTVAVVGVGVVISALSFFILMLSMSLLMEKHRDKLRKLVFLGYELREISRPYRRLIIIVSLGALVLSVCSAMVLREFYLSGIESLGGGGKVWLSIGVGIALSVVSVVANITSVGRRVKGIAEGL